MGGVSSALDPSRGRGVLSIPPGYKTPSFPSLYIPTLDTTIEQRGIFLYEAEAIWHFTLYWTLLLLGSLFLLCSTFASFTMLLNVTIYRPYSAASTRRQNLDIPQDKGKLSFAALANSDSSIRRRKRKRPPLWPILILPAAATAVSAAIALISGTVVGFALAAVYSAGGFSMSTWVPFLWALIQVLVLIISSYSTLTSIL
ncbi:hypothetical protein IAU60_004992 [Kwoniella sp. DSM 27419]